MRRSTAVFSAAIIATLLACDGSGPVPVRNDTGGYVITAVHRTDSTGIRGPNLLADPLLPGQTAEVPPGDGRLLVYDEDGDCYVPTTPHSPGDTVAVSLEYLLAKDIHAGSGSIPIMLVNNLTMKIYRVTDRSLIMSDHDYLGTATLWPAETLTVWSEPAELDLWVVDQGGAVLSTGPLAVEPASPGTVRVDSGMIYRGPVAASGGSGPLRLRVVNLLPATRLASLRLLALSDSAGPAVPNSPDPVLRERLDTLQAAVIACSTGRYRLEVVLPDSTRLSTAAFHLRRDTSRIFLRPSSLSRI
jgi:hypothetical protein